MIANLDRNIEMTVMFSPALAEGQCPWFNGSDFVSTRTITKTGIGPIASLIFRLKTNSYVNLQILMSMSLLTNQGIS